MFQLQVTSQRPRHVSDIRRIFFFDPGQSQLATVAAANYSGTGDFPLGRLRKVVGAVCAAQLNFGSQQGNNRNNRANARLLHIAHRVHEFSRTEKVLDESDSEISCCLFEVCFAFLRLFSDFLFQSRIF